MRWQPQRFSVVTQNIDGLHDLAAEEVRRLELDLESELKDEAIEKPSSASSQEVESGDVIEAHGKLGVFRCSNEECSLSWDKAITASGAIYPSKSVKELPESDFSHTGTSKCKLNVQIPKEDTCQSSTNVEIKSPSKIPHSSHLTYPPYAEGGSESASGSQKECEPTIDKDNIYQPPTCPLCACVTLPVALLFDEAYRSHTWYEWGRIKQLLDDWADAIALIGTSCSVRLTDRVLFAAEKRKLPVYYINTVPAIQDGSRGLTGLQFERPVRSRRQQANRRERDKGTTSSRSSPHPYLQPHSPHSDRIPTSRRSPDWRDSLTRSAPPVLHHQATGDSDGCSTPTKMSNVPVSTSSPQCGEERETKLQTADQAPTTPLSHSPHSHLTPSDCEYSSDEEPDGGIMIESFPSDLLVNITGSADEVFLKMAPVKWRQVTQELAAKRKQSNVVETVIGVKSEDEAGIESEIYSL
eukprot:GHVN01041026.1.p1 GENE.GHVN01041026.1~~GHVN01041026.1.p1  ORF type:complete len:468 (-),score=98.19 GHVN01041026.1:1502-2905(-)